MSESLRQAEANARESLAQGSSLITLPDLTLLLKALDEARRDTERLDKLLASPAVTRHDDGTATFAFVFQDASDLRAAIDALASTKEPR